MTPWTVAHQALLPREFSRQEYCSGLPCPSPRDFPNPGIKLEFPALEADSLPSKSQGSLARSEKEGGGDEEKFGLEPRYQ